MTKIHSGYLIGRALEPIGPGPWWEYIAIVKNYGDALAHATTLARAEGVGAWLHRGDDKYDPLPLDAE